MRHEDRKKVWIDHFQTRLAIRIGGYLVLFLAVLANSLFIWKLLTEGVGDPLTQFLELFRQYLPVIICLLVLVPVMAWDAIRFSHRLIGPLVRFRRTMQSITEGDTVRPIKLREGDHLIELRDDFNRMLESLQRRGVPVLKPDVPVEDGQSEKKLA
jgi:sensor histidine kinase YesM